jgi:diguanylate cyclase (GGDEF)-like protein/PAS domain S-box-containing protein
LNSQQTQGVDVKVLYLEDNPVDAELTRYALDFGEQRFFIDVECQIAGAFERLERDPSYDLVLSDLNLPDGSGLDLLTRVHELRLPIPVVILTGTGDQDAAVMALKAGADDYIVKCPGYLQRLPDALETTVTRFRANLFRLPRFLRVLYAEDNGFDADLTRRHLAQHAPHIRMDIVHRGEEVLTRLAATGSGATAYDVLMLDYSLPGVDALEIVKELHDVRGMDLPVVLVTGQGSEDVASGAMRLGVSDYLIKHPGYLIQLPSVLENAFNRSETLRDQARLQDSEARFRAIYNGVNDAILLLEPASLEILDANARTQDLFGWPPEEMAGAPATVLFPPGTAGTEFADRAGTALSGEPQLWEGPVQTRSGQSFWVELHVKSLELQGATRILVVIRDVDARKRAEEALARSERLYRALFESTGTALLLVEKDMTISLVNSQTKLLAGLPASAAPDDRLISRFIAPEDRDRLMDDHYRRRAGDQAVPSQFEFRFQVPNGRKRWGLASVALIPETGQSIVSVIDITDRKNAEERLRQSAAVFESTLEGVMITDAKGRITAINRAFTSITGYREEEVLGRDPHLLASGKHNTDFYRLMWRSIRDTGGWQGEIWNRRRNGETYPQWLSISAVRDENKTLTNYVGVFSDVSHIKESQQKLEHLSHYDPLTDLPNRRLLLSRLEHSLEQARRHSDRMALLFLDLDRFKDINDSLGHPAGDELLKQIAARMRSRLRDEDTLARLGGDEFVLLLEHLVRPESGASVAQTILEVVSTPFVLASREIYVTASIGISLYPDDARDVTGLMRNADTALYQAKAHGRNTYRFYTEALTRAAYDRLSLEGRLRRALEREEFEVFYQPQIAIRGGAMVGVEALVRWRCPDEGLIAPERFISLAEETGLILPLGDWVLRTACQQLRAWLYRGWGPVRLAVNLSARQFEQGDLAQRVKSILDETDVPPNAMELELTESVLMSQAERAVRTVRGLKDLGVRLAVDDFGTGYSSLAYLKRFTVDILKIDRSFVRDIPEDRNDAAIVATIIAMAKTLGIGVVGEGVETQHQLDYLRQQGCDLYQGYLVCPPVDAADLARRWRGD